MTKKIPWFKLVRGLGWLPRSDERDNIDWVFRNAKQWHATSTKSHRFRHVSGKIRMLYLYYSSLICLRNRFLESPLGLAIFFKFFQWDATHSSGGGRSWPSTGILFQEGDTHRWTRYFSMYRCTEYRHISPKRWHQCQVGILIRTCREEVHHLHVLR